MNVPPFKYGNYVIDIHSYPTDGGYYANASVRRDDGGAMVVTPLYGSQVFPTEDEAVLYAKIMARRKIDAGLRK